MKKSAIFYFCLNPKFLLILHINTIKIFRLGLGKAACSFITFCFQKMLEGGIYLDLNEISILPFVKLMCLYHSK